MPLCCTATYRAPGRSRSGLTCLRFSSVEYSRSRRTLLVVRADEEIIPIVSGREKKSFSPSEYEQLRNAKLLGGKTIGEELALIREQ